MNLSRHVNRIEYLLARTIRTEGAQFARWTHKNGFVYKGGRWRKRGSIEPVTELRMWEEYDRATSSRTPSAG